MKDLDAVYSDDLMRKEVREYREKDRFINMVIDRYNKSLIKRNVWNLVVGYIECHHGSVLGDMLFVAYRMGIVDGTKNTDAQ